MSSTKYYKCNMAESVQFCTENLVEQGGSTKAGQSDEKMNQSNNRNLSFCIRLL